MPTKPVISNNSPLVALWKLDLLSLLRDLYTEVWIPREVEKEFCGTEKKSRQEALNNAPWIKTVDLTDSEKASVYNRLDSGEAAVGNRSYHLEKSRPGGRSYRGRLFH